jgi:isohexenylglutaconyl-CoA hydratase
MGRSEAARFCLQGNVMDAAEAHRLGLVHALATEASGLEASLSSVIADILEGAPGALAETKALIAALGATVPGEYAEAGAQSFARRASSPEAEEGIASFKARRRPSWSPAA